MKCKRFRTAVSNTWVVMTIGLLTAFVLPSGAWAASEYRLLHGFDWARDGASPQGPLVFDASGNLYGVARANGPKGGGTAFKLVRQPDGHWAFNVIYGFKCCADGDGLSPYVTFDAKGNLYGTMVAGGIYGLGVVYKLTPNPDRTWTKSVLYNATSQNGGNPYGSVIFGKDGSLYFAATVGGAHANGAICKLTPNDDGSWTESTIYFFEGGAAGGNPVGSLTFDAAGALYGVAGGGTADRGVMYKLTPNQDGSWTERVLYSFSEDEGSGDQVWDKVGNVYGTSQLGGLQGLGSVYKLTAGRDGNWAFNVVYSFKGGADGFWPGGGVVVDSEGSLYGTTFAGGGQRCIGSGCGTVFKLTPEPNGEWTEQVLRTYAGSWACNPVGQLLLDEGGTLYGTTSNAGCPKQHDGPGKNDGTVFELKP